MVTQAPERAAIVRTGWDDLVRRAAAAEIGLLAVAAVGLRDLEAAALTLGGLVALALTRFRGGLLGKLGLALLSTNVAFWMASGATSNLTHGEGFWETALPVALTVAAGTTTVASVASLLKRSGGARATATAAVAILVTGLVAAAVGIGNGADVRAGDIEVVAEDVKFSATELSAPAGDVTVFVANKDLFWHTFTIKELDVNVNVPVGGERRETFNAPAGSYEFVCMIPGHAQAGMKGTLRVR